MSAFVIVNPRSGGGKTLRAWRSLEPALASIYPYMSVAFTRRPGEATQLAAAALREGHSEIVAVGGGGTANETVNGFFNTDGAISPDAVLAFVSSGAGHDSLRTFGRDETGEQSITRLKQSHVHSVDVGRVQFLSRDGLPRTRYFANIASFGLTGMIADAINRSPMSALFGSKFAFGWHTTMGLLRYNGRAARIIVDSAFDEIVDIAAVAVVNGRVFGSGMQLVSSAKADDGQFDVVIIKSGPKARMLASLKMLYRGERIDDPNVLVIPAKRIVAAPVAQTKGRPVLIETDGEGVGRLPATFDILPGALNVRF